ncbi:ATP-binding protein [Gulosibacter bifidus]|uniref:AAA family ATPase n=1 Tax=Gulosibacter bifidus TaxID=272239 RepID=A0ABW5RM81_9MICO|nr:ATP-binding protein [Gulosibacter bifidus]
MDPKLNPYTPNAGAAPEVLIGRDDQLESFETLLARLARGRTEQSMIITGLRGVGKTVLLNKFEHLATDANWEVVSFEASKGDDEEFRRKMFTQLKGALLRLSPRARWDSFARDAAAALSSFALVIDHDARLTASWGVDPSEGVADHGDIGLDLTDTLVAVGKAAQARKRGVAILIDEVQFLQPAQLEALIQSVHRTVQLKLPVTFVGAGLPQIAELAGDAKSYAERLFKFPVIGELSYEEAIRALRDPAAAEGVEFETDAAELAVDFTRGYPYFIQELGYQAWIIAEGPTITARDVEEAREAYEEKLDSSFFRVRLDRATPLQAAYMRAMAELGPAPQKAADVAKLLQRDSSQLGPARAQLIEMGLLYTPAHGYAAFTVPDFDRFMLRAMPELEIPNIARRKRRG